MGGLTSRDTSQRMIVQRRAWLRRFPAKSLDKRRRSFDSVDQLVGVRWRSRVWDVANRNDTPVWAMRAELPDQPRLPVVRNRVAEQEQIAIVVRDVQLRFLCRCGRDHFITG